MVHRETRSVRVDPEVWSAFISWVEDKEGQKHGEIGRHVETALQEYTDHGRIARLEEKVDTLLARSNPEPASHTHKQSASETVTKARDIFERLTENHGTIIKDDDVKRAVEDIAGGDPRTVDKYRDILKRRDLLFEHPSGQPVWTTERDRYIEWAENYIDNNPTVETHDVIEDYSLSTREYDEIANKIQSH